MAARQIGELRSQTHGRKKAPTDRTWPLITSADPSDWSAAQLLRCRRQYWGIEAGHQRLDTTLDEDRSRVRTARGMTVLGMFRRLAVSFASAWLDHPTRRKTKPTTPDFLNFLHADNSRRAFSLMASANPTAWKAG